MDTYFTSYSLLILLLVCDLCYTGVTGKPIEGAQISNETTQIAITFLGKYGYIVPTHLRSPDKLKNQLMFLDGLKRFQYFSSLEITGVVDSPTLELMKKARCGVPDPPVELPRRRRKRYSIQGSRWLKNTIVWKLAKHGRTLKRDHVKRAINKAAKLWSDAVNVNFREAVGSEYVDMWITFASGYHGDPRAFDGPDGTLGHAFYPASQFGLSGDIHFDNDENWVYKTKGGYDIVQAMVHEMGHALGLRHSQIKDAIMSPTQEYGEFKRDVQLHIDDIQGLQRLYGPAKKKKVEKPKVVEKPKTVTKPKETRKFCPRSYITSIYYDKRYNLFVATTDNQLLYFMYTSGKIRSGPKPVSNYFASSVLPGRIDATFTTDKIYDEQLTVVFVGKSYYLFSGFRYWSGPHSIHSRYEENGVSKTPLEIVLPDWVQRVEAAFTWVDGDTYIFSGRWFWRYGYGEKRFRRGYPRVISTAWKGVPNRVHAAYTMADGTRALLYKNRVYQLEKNRKQVARGFPKYLGSTNVMHCKYSG